MDIGTKIKELRKEKGFSQKQLANASDLSVASIQGYEQGKYNPKKETLTKIAKALGVSVADLDPDTYFFDLTDKQRNIIELFAGTGGFKSLHDEPIDITKEQIEETKKRAIISLKDKYLAYFNDLNDTGKEKAIEQIELLTKIPEYKKDPGNDNQNQE